MPPTIRRIHRPAFKLQVMLHAEEHGNRAAGHQFGIGEASVHEIINNLLHTIYLNDGNL